MATKPFQDVVKFEYDKTKYLTDDTAGPFQDVVKFEYDKTLKGFSYFL